MGQVIPLLLDEGFDFDDGDGGGGDAGITYVCPDCEGEAMLLTTTSVCCADPDCGAELCLQVIEDMGEA